MRPFLHPGHLRCLKPWIFRWTELGCCRDTPLPGREQFGKKGVKSVGRCPSSQFPMDTGSWAFSPHPWLTGAETLLMSPDVTMRTNQRSNQWVLWIKKNQLWKKSRTFTQFRRGALAPETMPEEQCGHAPPCWSRSIHHGLFLPRHTVRNGWSGQVMCLTSLSHGGGGWALPSPPRQPSSAHGGPCGLSFSLPHSILPPSPSLLLPLPSSSFSLFLSHPPLSPTLNASVSKCEQKLRQRNLSSPLWKSCCFLIAHSCVRHSLSAVPNTWQQKWESLTSLPLHPPPPNRQVSLAWLSRQPWAGTVVVDKAGALPTEEHTCCWPWLPAPLVLQWGRCEWVASAGGLAGPGLNSTKSYWSRTIKQSITKKKKKKKSGLLWASPMEQRK